MLRNLILIIIIIIISNFNNSIFIYNIAIHDIYTVIFIYINIFIFINNNILWDIFEESILETKINTKIDIQNRYIKTSIRLIY